MQTFREIGKEELFAEAARRKRDGWRLAQVSATDKGKYDLIYSFERDGELVNFRVGLAYGEAVDSVSSVYPYAFLYENEMADLFGVQVVGMNVDFHGALYQTAVKTPFHVGEIKGGEAAT